MTVHCVTVEPIIPGRGPHTHITVYSHLYCVLYVYTFERQLGALFQCDPKTCLIEIVPLFYCTTSINYIYNCLPNDEDAAVPSTIVVVSSSKDVWAYKKAIF